MKQSLNIAELLIEQAKLRPHQKAVIFPKRKADQYIYEHLTFSDLNEVSNKYAKSFLELGIKKGTKTLVFLKPGPDFSSVTFALFKIGAVPIFIDPGMGKDNLLSSIEKIAPQAIIGIPKVHFLRMFFSESFNSLNIFVTSGNFSFSGEIPLKNLRNRLKKVELDEVLEKTAPDDLAAILFTSGGTGKPKGVEYTHQIFWHQTHLLKEMFGLTPEDIDIPGFPLFSFFTLSLGMTSCIPDMDPSKPAKAKGEKLYQVIKDNKATFLAGSPSIWENLADYLKTNGLELPSIKHIAMFGAPVSPTLLAKFKKALPKAKTYTPYGATEALPLSLIESSTILDKTQYQSLKGRGTCVGHPISAIEVKIIEITDSPIEKISDIKEKSIGEIGEIIVSGPIVTSRYYDMESETKLSKIKDENRFWHRMGDLGYLDSEGLLWFCGRKAHRIQDKDRLDCSVNLEAIFNQHSMIKKSALINIGEKENKKAALVIQRVDGKTKDRNYKILKRELLDLANSNPMTKHIQDIYVTKKFPLDVRHNIKIDRKKLSHLAKNGELS